MEVENDGPLTVFLYKQVVLHGHYFKECLFYLYNIYIYIYLSL